MKALSFVMGLVALVVGCSKPVSAMSTCQQLEEAGVAVPGTCKVVTPGGLSVAAAERVDFDLVSVSGKGGSVMRFESDETYNRTVDSYKNMAELAGPHRYGKPSKRIFVQMNEGASADAATRAQGVLGKL